MPRLAMSSIWSGASSRRRRRRPPAPRRSRPWRARLGGVDHRLEVAEVGRVGVDLCRDHDLVLVADCLGVVALDVAARRLDVPRVRVGDVDLARRRRRRLVGRRRPAEAAAVLHHPARAVGLVSRVRAAVHVVILFQPPLALPQPLRARLRDRLGFAARFSSRRRLASAASRAGPAPSPARAAARRRGGRRTARPRPGRPRPPRPGSPRRSGRSRGSGAAGVRVQLRAIDRQHRHANQTGVRAQRQHLAEQARQRRLVALAEARDRAVIGPWFAAITRTATSSTHARSITRDDRRPVAYP